MMIIRSILADIVMVMAILVNIAKMAWLITDLNLRTLRTKKGVGDE